MFSKSVGAFIDNMGLVIELDGNIHDEEMQKETLQGILRKRSRSLAQRTSAWSADIYVRCGNCGA